MDAIVTYDESGRISSVDLVADDPEGNLELIAQEGERVVRVDAAVFDLDLGSVDDPKLATAEHLESVRERFVVKGDGKVERVPAED